MLRKLFKTGVVSSLFCAGSIISQAQELNCKVTVMHDKITVADPQVFNGLQRAVTEFMNGHKWTTDDFAAIEKIDCNILINLTANGINGDPDVYTATIGFQASRPVYNSTYSTTIINNIDKDAIFKFTQFNPLRFDDNQVNGSDPLSANLTAILGYYAYMTLAFDYDSYAPSGGTQFLKKAQNVVTNAPEAKGVNGWKSAESSRNRFWLVDQMLNTRFQDFRNYWYTFHRESLDSMYTKPVEARTRILANVRKLYQVNRENPSSALIQLFFASKSDEMLRILAQAPKAERLQYITMLNAIDVPNSAKYNALKQ